MRVSIIIPAKNGGNVLGKCLEGIERQDGDHKIETIIVDSGSRDDTVTIARNHNARVETIPAYSFTHGAARNLGAARSKGEILVFLNQDVIPIGQNWLENLVTPLQDGVSASYSRQIPPPGTPYNERIFLRRFYPDQEQTYTRETLRQRGAEDIVLFSTVSGAVKKLAWQSLRFNEHVIMSEDQEFACRLLLAGQQIRYQPDSMVYHANRYNMIDAFRRYFDSGWSMTSLPELRVRSFGRSARLLAQMTTEVVLDDEASIVEKLRGLNLLASKIIGFGLGQFAPHMPEALRSKISHTRSIVSQTRLDDSGLTKP